MVCLIFIKDLLIKTPIVYYNIEENILTPQFIKIIFLLNAVVKTFKECLYDKRICLFINKQTT